MYTTLISSAELAEHLQDPEWVVVDARFSLVDADSGLRHYRQSHLQGAVYAHLNQDLSGPILPDRTSRHPLPEVEQAAAVFGRLGIGPTTQVVTYDDVGGALAAVRVWWMLRWLGHPAVAVLDGGWQRARTEGLPRTSGDETRPERVFTARVRPELAVSSNEVERLRLDPAYRLGDARAPERYRGEKEPIDPVAGHIPGAISTPYTDNLSAQGLFLPAEVLRQRYAALLAGAPAWNAVFYCGSGVTSAHNILAMQHAGLGEARLYAGSWSEWIIDPNRPVALGAQPFPS